MRSTKTVPLPALDTWSAAGTAELKPYNSVAIHVLGAPMPIVIPPTSRVVTLGRDTKVGQPTADVDFAAFNAYEKGVSRVHAMLRREQDTLTIEDLQSGNGTHVNGKLLIPTWHYVVHHGDEVRLGRLVTNIYFE